MVDPSYHALNEHSMYIAAFWAAAPIGDEVLKNGEIFRPSVHPFVRPSVRPSVSQSVRLPVCLSLRPSVRSSVRPSLNISGTAHLIFLKLCMKFGVNKVKKVTRPEF